MRRFFKVGDPVPPWIALVLPAYNADHFTFMVPCVAWRDADDVYHVAPTRALAGHERLLRLTAHVGAPEPQICPLSTVFHDTPCGLRLA